MGVYLKESGVHWIHITEEVDGVRITHDRLATQEEIKNYNEELVQQEQEVLKNEFKECIEYLDSTRWIYDKEKDGFDITKHQDIITKRVETRNRINEIQELIT